jgi:hypothetical protein
MGGQLRAEAGSMRLSKLVQNLLLKLCQSLRNFYQNLLSFSKTTNFLSLFMTVTEVMPMDR